MRYLHLLLIGSLLSGCASFGRGLGEAFVESDKVELKRCEIEGFEYTGINPNFFPHKYQKVLMVHGVGTHHPGYSRRLQQNLANQMGLSVMSRLPKNITLLDPSDEKTIIGNLRITFWQDRSKQKNMLFYELTWSEITTPEKKVIAFDDTEQYSKFRVPFNNMMKEFLDNALPDPMIYLIDREGLILDSSKQALCFMLSTDWQDIPDNQAKVCSLSNLDAIKEADKQNYIFITHSLGSKILMDAIMYSADNIAQAQQEIVSEQERGYITRLQDKEFTVFMLANQLPILQIGHKPPKVHNQINSYCTPNGKKYASRIFKGVNIVAFSDPNDILSYPIPQSFADKYIDSRICPKVTNVSVNVAPEISAFGVGIVNPVAAHTDYDNSPKVLDLITHGTSDFDEDTYLKDKCHFIKMKRDIDMHL